SRPETRAIARAGRKLLRCRACRLRWFRRSRPAGDRRVRLGPLVGRVQASMKRPGPAVAYRLAVEQSDRQDLLGRRADHEFVGARQLVAVDATPFEADALG